MRFGGEHNPSQSILPVLKLLHHLLPNSRIHNEHRVVFPYRSLDPNTKNKDGRTPLLLAAKNNQRHALKYASQWNNGLYNDNKVKMGLLRLFDFGAIEENTGFSVLHYVTQNPSLALLMEMSIHPSCDPLVLDNDFKVCHQYIPKIYVTSKKLVRKWEKDRFLRDMAIQDKDLDFAESLKEFEREIEMSRQEQNRSRDVESLGSQKKSKIRLHLSLKNIRYMAGSKRARSPLINPQKKTTESIPIKLMETSSFTNFKHEQRKSTYKRIKLRNAASVSALSQDSISNSSIKGNFNFDHFSQTPISSVAKRQTTPIMVRMRNRPQSMHQNSPQGPAIVLSSRGDHEPLAWPKKPDETVLKVLRSALENKISRIQESIKNQIMSLSNSGNSSVITSNIWQASRSVYLLIRMNDAYKSVSESKKINLGSGEAYKETVGSLRQLHTFLVCCVTENRWTHFVHSLSVYSLYSISLSTQANMRSILPSHISHLLAKTYEIYYTRISKQFPLGSDEKQSDCDQKNMKMIEAMMVPVVLNCRYPVVCIMGVLSIRHQSREEFFRKIYNFPQNQTKSIKLSISSKLTKHNKAISINFRDKRIKRDPDEEGDVIENSNFDREDLGYQSDRNRSNQNGQIANRISLKSAGRVKTNEENG